MARASAPQRLHAALGAPPHASCGPLPAGAACWYCGGDAGARGVARERWMGANFVGQNRVRCWASPWVCEACVLVCAWETPATLPVPGQASKPGAKRDLMWRLFTVLCDGGAVRAVTKGDKPAIRAFLRGAHAGDWFCALAESGQKHVIPTCPVNPGGGPAGRGLVAFEERVVVLGDWTLVDDLAALLTAGASKETVATGAYTPAQHALCGAAIEAFEARWARQRASGWWDLALWLAQRDEAAVAARMDVDKAARAAAKGARRRDEDAGRERAAAAGGADGALAAGDAGGVPGDGHAERAAALGPAARPRADRGAHERRRRAVGEQPAAAARPERAEPAQLGLFGRAGDGGA
jgi:hypothetical protein